MTGTESNAFLIEKGELPGSAMVILPFFRAPKSKGQSAKTYRERFGKLWTCSWQSRIAAPIFHFSQASEFHDQAPRTVFWPWKV
jgi:hypothetical protein